MHQGKEIILTGAVLRAARALVDVSAAQLAIDAGVGERTILRAEKDDGPCLMRLSNASSIVAALKDRGVVFLSADAGGGPGVRLES